MGHVTIDVMPDGSRRAGGSALYSALQAFRLGLRARIVTRGVPAEIEALLDPYRDELDLRIEAAASTTTLLTSGEGDGRRQRVLAWAGPMECTGPLRCSILHLAPVAAELPADWIAGGELVGLTPQGLVRGWSEQRPEVILTAASEAAVALAARCDAVVLSEQEREACGALIEAALDGGAVVAITAGAAATTILSGGEQPLVVEVGALERPIEDLGAGDVYASAFFVALHEGSSPAQAATFASAAAAERMLGPGPEAIARRPAIEARLLRAETG